MAGVSFGVLGNGETCTGDSARRAGNEFLFQGLAQQNVETFKEHKVKKVVSTCAHCFNTLKNEYKDFGIELEVVHHTQLLNRLVREGKLTPVKDGDGAHKRSITYHDPCYIGRHNGVYAPPRDLLEVMPGATYVEMERNCERSFCCGAGGARMWMEETIGERINVDRTDEAVGTGADQIAVGCPFCRVMLDDGLTEAQDKGNAREEVEVLDVAQMLLASVKGQVATKLKPGEGGDARRSGREGQTHRAGGGDEASDETTVKETATSARPRRPSGRSSLFDTPAESETAERTRLRPRKRRPRSRPAPVDRCSTSVVTTTRPSRTRSRSPRPKPRRPSPRRSRRVRWLAVRHQGGRARGQGRAEGRGAEAAEAEAEQSRSRAGGSLFDSRPSRRQSRAEGRAERAGGGGEGRARAEA